MDKLLTLIIDLFITISICFLAVLIYFGLRTESVIKAMDQETVENFITDIKENGSMTTNDYENFLTRLSLTGILYDISFEHKYCIFEPEYRMRTIDEIIAAQKAAYMGTNVYTYQEVVTQVPKVTDPINNDGLTMNTETNESILAKSAGTPASGHTHSTSCYAGHIHTGNQSFTHSHAHNTESSCTRFLSGAGFIVKCNSCGANYWAAMAAYYWDNGPKTAWVNTSPARNCIYCNSTILTLTEKNQYFYNCGYVMDIDGDGFYDEIANGVVKEYPGYASPQGNTSKTYASGCYSYHNTKFVLGNDFGMIPTRDSAESAVNTLRDNNFTGYCKIPKYYRIGLSSDGQWSRAEAYTIPEGAYVCYTAFLDTDGSIKFKYQYLWDMYRGVYTTNEVFPDVLDINGMRDMMIGRFYSYYYYATKIDLLGNYAGRMHTYTQWYSPGYRLSNGSYQWYDATEYLDICGFDHSLGINKWVPTCGQVENAALVCHKKVISITPTNPNQSVYTGEALITAVTATYLDGSTNVVLAETSFNTALPISNKTVTLSYTDALGNVNTCSVKVNVVPKIRICVNGHTYNLNQDGSDPGCPYCKAYVKSLRIINPLTSSLTITLGTTLVDNGVTILVTYLDGHTMTLNNGYEDNLDKKYYGTKLVTIGYQGATTSIMVTSICAKMTCDICGFVYDLYPDGTNPGCPRCISKTPVFTGNVMNYEVIETTDEIVDKLYENGNYKLNMDNTFTVTIQNRSSTMARSYLQMIYPGLSKQWLYLSDSENIKAK